MAADWQRVKSLFDEALALAPGERRAFVGAASADAAVREEALSLLAHASLAESDELLALPAAAAALAPLAAPSDEHARIGQRLGAWTITGPLGTGGMGEVLRARRADGAYEGEAAIKVLKPGMDSAALLARFGQEQRALARLNHPHIARLFDAGLTPDQRPYFVMELVEGLPIDRAARERSLEERLALFLQLTDAVAHAHRQLLVHRDLKPSNVLVDAQGQVKLLDFGIAKALDVAEAAAELTATGERPFTPLYASPEQVRGEPVGTATDVYSLGVLLYQLLTGTRPTGRRATTPMEIARSVLEEEPTRPSRLAPAEATDPQWPLHRKRIADDLDNIVLKALEKLPERRYASVDAMAADLRAFLGGYPVSARPASAAYVLQRFVLRNRWALLAAGLGTLGLATGLIAAVAQGRAAVAVGALGMGAGLVLALVQARSAARSRDAAQARFEDLRQLAHAVLFDYHNLVEPLAGSTPVRQRLVNDALVYLDRLSKAAPSDRRVLLEMGMAYHTVGLVLRNGFRRPHLGDTAGAMRAFERSIVLLRQLVDEDDADEAAAYELALALSARAGVLGEDLQLAPARRDLAEAAALFTRHLANDTPDLRHRLELARTHLRLADVLRFAQLHDEALGWVEEARRTLRSLAALQPDHQELPHVWVWVHNIESWMAREREDWHAMVAAEDQIWALMLALHQREPDNARFLEDLAGSAHWRMAACGRLGEVEQVRHWADEAVSRWRRLARADPENRSARRAYFNILATSAWAFVEAGAAEQGREQFDALQPEAEAWAGRFGADFDARRQLATFLAARAVAHAVAGQADADRSAQARAAVDALQRDFQPSASTSALGIALPPLRTLVELADSSCSIAGEARIALAREALKVLGVR